MTRYGVSLVVLVVIVFGVLWAFTVPNAAHHPRTAALAFDPQSPFDFGYIEFSEHGNLFDRDAFEELLQEIESTEERGATAAVVFVHGWHHNASSTQVNEFRELLSQIADVEQGPYRDKRVVGLYVGWRGEIINLPVVREMTFWDRKSVAQEVAHGGVTEVLLRLERLSRCGSRYKPCREEKHRDNRLIILGHSFGGAIVLSALSEVFTERLVNAEVLQQDACEDELGDRSGRYSQKRGAPCVLAEPFAHAVVLLNPAIEANQALQLKELVSSFRFPDSQDILMHVLSSEGDLATRWAFPAGQWLRNLTWDEASISRTYSYSREQARTVTHPEGLLTVTTIGNYAPFRSGWVGSSSDEFFRCWDSTQRANCRSGDSEARIPMGANEPIQLLLTDQGFMASHNDVFNCKVKSYVLAIAQESVSTAAGERFSFRRHYSNFLKACSRSL